MANVLNRTTKQYLESVNTPDYSEDDWIINPDLSDVVGVPTQYWIIDGDAVHEMTVEEIDSNPQFLYAAIVTKITELSIAAQQNIINGFQSDALGEARIYDSQIEDQLNLIGAVSSVAPTEGQPSGGTIYYSSRDVATQTKTYLPHTYTQLREVLDDGAAFKLAILVQFNTIKAQVIAMTSVSAIQAVTWHPVVQ